MRRLQRLAEAFRLYGGPVVFLFLLCLGFGTLLVAVGSGVGKALILAGSGALLLFVLLAARRRYRPSPRAVTLRGSGRPSAGPAAP